MWENCHDYDPDAEKSIEESLAEMRAAAAVCKKQREAADQVAAARSKELYDQAKANIEADPRVEEWRAQADAQLATSENRRLERLRDEVPMYKALQEAAKYAGKNDWTDEEIRAKDRRFAMEAGEALREAQEAALLKDEPGRPAWMQKRVHHKKGGAAFLRALYNSGQWTNRNPDVIQLESLVADTVEEFLYWDRLEDEDFTWEQMKSVISEQGVSLMDLMNKFLWAFKRSGLFKGQEGTYVGYKQEG